MTGSQSQRGSSHPTSGEGLPELERLTIDGLSIGYRRSGTGPPLVLLHGFLCDSRCWREQLIELARYFTVIAWDAPGAGASDDPVADFTFTDWSRALVGFLDALGVSSTTMLGLSWGGVLAQEFYRRNPSRVNRLILAGTYAGWKGSLRGNAVAERLARCERDSRLSPQEFVARWVPEMFSDAATPDVRADLGAVFADFHPDGFRMMARSLAETDTCDLLPAIRLPTLLIWGDEDERSPRSIAEQFREAIRDAALCVIERAGHLSNMEQPAAFNDCIVGFCSRS